MLTCKFEILGNNKYWIWKRQIKASNDLEDKETQKISQLHPSPYVFNSDVYCLVTPPIH